MDSPARPGIATPAPRSRRLVVIVWLFVGIFICLLALTIYSVSLISGGRSLVSAEGRWAKAQREAVFRLARYATDRDEQDFRRFERASEVPLGDRRARTELAKAKPDLAVVREALAQAHTSPEDADEMIELFQRLKRFEPMERAMVLWAQGDRYFDEMTDIARELRRLGPRASPSQARRLMERIDRVDAALGSLEEEFGATLGETQRSAQRMLLGGLLTTAGVLLVVGIGVSRRILTQTETMQKNLLESEGQLRNLIQSAPLPLLIIRRADRHLTYANERALQQFALTGAQAYGRLMSDFYANPEDGARLMEAVDRDGVVRDQELLMQDRNGRHFWLLVSAQRIRYGAEQCILAALHNIDDRKRLQEDMRRRAMHDGLTNLPNRAMFMDALAQALRKGRRHGKRLTVLFIDLDRFKVVNDTLGHAAGDQLLLAVSERLRAAVRESDLVARLGGDEFVVLIEEHGGPEEVMIVAQKVLSLLERPVLIEWRNVSISASIGIASYPDDGADVEALVKNADIAMYQAKERGRNNFQFYSADLNRLTLQRFELETRLRGALEREEFFLHYEPEIDLATGGIVGVEALIRWNDPQTGVVMPADFVPLAEETGTIVAIGRWAIERAVRDLRTWIDKGIELTMSVNISARQLQNHELVNDIFQSLQRHAVEPKRLRLEVTETMMMHEAPVADRALRALKGLGVELAVDDFGTGFSSLSLVRRFPIHVVKIDKSFVAGCPHNRECVAIVQAVIAMAHTLGLRVVAEGVETEEQRQVVTALGCDGAQGYYFSKPIEASRIPALVAQPELGSSRESRVLH